MRRKSVIFAAVAAAVILACAGVAACMGSRGSLSVPKIPEFSFSETPSAETSEAAQTQTTPTIAAEPAETEKPAETAETEQPEQPTQPTQRSNVLLTSVDPQHYARLEFADNSDNTVKFSGVYTAEDIDSVSVLRVKRSSLDFTRSGSSFSGSIDLSGLDEGFYILRFVTVSDSVMDYVFEVTEQGAQPLPEDELPTEKNLSVTNAPLEIPADTVLKIITADGDRQTAAQVLSEVRELSDRICAGISGDLDKARAIADWMAKNIFYDHDAKNNGVTDDMLTLEHLLLNHRSVCYGWTNLYAALCQAQGIECLNVNGSVVTGSRCFLETEPADERAHSWNLLIIDGQKIWVDTVWDSTNRYEYKYYSNGVTDLQYFGISNEALAQDHRAMRCERRDYFGAVE